MSWYEQWLSIKASTNVISLPRRVKAQTRLCDSVLIVVELEFF